MSFWPCSFWRTPKYGREAASLRTSKILNANIPDFPLTSLIPQGSKKRLSQWHTRCTRKAILIRFFTASSVILLRSEDSNRQVGSRLHLKTSNWINSQYQVHYMLCHSDVKTFSPWSQTSDCRTPAAISTQTSQMSDQVIPLSIKKEVTSKSMSLFKDDADRYGKWQSAFIMVRRWRDWSGLLKERNSKIRLVT